MFFNEIEQDKTLSELLDIYSADEITYTGQVISSAGYISSSSDNVLSCSMSLKNIFTPHLVEKGYTKVYPSSVLCLSIMKEAKTLYESASDVAATVMLLVSFGV